MSSLSASVKVVRLAPTPDPAIDHQAMRAEVDAEGVPILARYIQTRDASLLKVREGATPTWFIVRRLPAAWFNATLALVWPVEARRELALRAAVHMIEVPDAPLVVSPPGTRKAAFEATAADHGVTLAPPEWVQEIADRWGLEAVQELGQVAIDLARLPKGARGPFGFWGGTAVSA